MSTLESNGFFVLRSPLLPYKSIEKLTETEIRVLVKNNTLFREAIFLSSFEFYTIMLRWLDGDCQQNDEEKILATLRKYISRMSYRSTPFGISAGVSFGKFGLNDTIQFPKTTKSTRYCRLDMTFLSAYIDSLLKEGKVIPYLKFYTNNTYVDMGNKWRYLEYRSIGNGRQHESVSIEKTEYLERIIKKAAEGTSYQTICSVLTEDGFEPDDVKSFVNELISAKVLLSEWELSPESDNELNKLFDILKIARHPHEQTIGDIIAVIDIINGSSLESIDAIICYKELIAHIEKLGLNLDKRLIFQVDLSKNFEDLTLRDQINDNLFEALEFLSKIKPRQAKSELDRFCQAFFERYEYGEVPLVEVLDGEMGIGYPYRVNKISKDGELLSGIPSGTPTQTYPSFNWTPWQKQLLDRYTEAIKGESRVIHFSASESLNNAGAKSAIPPTAYTVCKIFSLKESGDKLTDVKLLHILTSGPSSIDLISRFCYMDEHMAQKAYESIAVERRSQNDIYAEILHINQPRAGNISKHPQFYDYHIPILSRGGAATVEIPLRDLTVSIVNGQLTLRSKKFGKRVIPRLSTAHNYTQNTIPYYRFLCDLQYQGCTGDLYWDWGFLASMSYLPRVEFGNVILSRESWLLERGELDSLKKAKENSLQSVNEFLARKRIPQHVTIREADYEMPIDLLNIPSLEILLDLTEKKSSVRLEENLFHTEGFLLSDEGVNYTNDVVIPFQQKKNNLEHPRAKNSSMAPRNFFIGSEWMYVKIYCTAKISNIIISEVILPLTQTLTAAGVIDYWFFIRYNDPEYHLRFRMHIVDDQHSIAMKYLSKSLAEYLENGKVKEFKMDTYKRELERYAHGCYAESERLFYEDSLLVSHSLGRADQEWHMAIRGVNRLLIDFGLTLEEMVNITDHWQQSYKSEFGISKMQLTAFKSKYRALRPKLEIILQQKNQDEWDSIFADRSLQVAKFLSSTKVGINLDMQISSYVHMFLNRLFMDNQRKKEMVVYDLIHQYYKGKLAKEKYLNKELT